MSDYEGPAIVATFDVEEMRREAAACFAYLASDASLKREIEPVEEPLRRLGEIRDHE